MGVTKVPPWQIGYAISVQDKIAESKLVAHETDALLKATKDAESRIANGGEDGTHTAPALSSLD